MKEEGRGEDGLWGRRRYTNDRERDRRGRRIKRQGGKKKWRGKDGE